GSDKTPGQALKLRLNQVLPGHLSVAGVQKSGWGHAQVNTLIHSGRGRPGSGGPPAPRGAGGGPGGPSGGRTPNRARPAGSRESPRLGLVRPAAGRGKVLNSLTNNPKMGPRDGHADAIFFGRRARTPLCPEGGRGWLTAARTGSRQRRRPPRNCC